MPIITVQMWSGRDDEAKEKLIRGLTDVTCETFDLPEDAVTVLLVEIEKKHWGAGGLPSTKKFPDAPADE